MHTFWKISMCPLPKKNAFLKIGQLSFLWINTKIPGKPSILIILLAARSFALRSGRPFLFLSPSPFLLGKKASPVLRGACPLVGREGALWLAIQRWKAESLLGHSLEQHVNHALKVAIKEQMVK